MTANGEVLAKVEATVYVRELDLFVTVMLLEETPAVLSLGKLCEDHGYNYHWTSGQKPHLIKKGKKIRCDTSIHVPFVVLGLSTNSSTWTSPTSSTSLSQDSVIGTENPATERSGSMSAEVTEKPVAKTQQKLKTQIKVKTTKNFQVNHCVICWIGYRNSERIWLMKVFLQSHGETRRMNIETLPVLLMDSQWSREQKWNLARVSTAFILTFRRTEIQTSAWGRKLQGLLAEDPLVQSCPKQEILVI